MKLTKKTFLAGLLILVFGFIIQSPQAFARNFVVKSLTVENLDSYAESNVTLYLVHASKVFGSEFTVNKIFKVLTTSAIKNKKDISFGPFTIKQSWSSFMNPNAVVAVVHDQARHALNKHGVIDGTPTTFAEPEYQNQGERVPATGENQKLRSRASRTLSELNSNPTIRF